MLVGVLYCQPLQSLMCVDVMQTIWLESLHRGRFVVTPTSPYRFDVWNKMYSAHLAREQSVLVPKINPFNVCYRLFLWKYPGYFL